MRVDDERHLSAPTMSTSPEAPSKPAGDPEGVAHVVLPEQIRRRLGSLLAAAYAQEDAELDTAGHFADVLAKLDTALGAARSRDEADFQKRLLAVGPSLRRFAISLAHDVTAADDLVQETLLRGWRNRAHFQPGTNLEAWTFTILRNHFYSERRKRREVQDVQAALGRIPEVMREALMLVTVSDLPYEEVAEIMGWQLGTVKSRVWRARDLLARALGYAGAEIGTDSVMLSALSGASEARG